MKLEEIIENIGIKPYHQEDAGVIYCADCRDILPKMPLERDLIAVTDPPYGININYGSNIDDSKEYLMEIINNILPLISTYSKIIAITTGVLNQYLYPMPSWCLGWFHGGGSASSVWGFSNWQPILVYGKDPYLSKGLGRRPDALMINCFHEKTGHPCAKPIKFWKWLVKRVSIVNEIILDPFLGSGTTAVAAKELGRKFIGIEISEEYCKIAVKRLRQGVLNFE